MTLVVITPFALDRRVYQRGESIASEHEAMVIQNPVFKQRVVRKADAQPAAAEPAAKTSEFEQHEPLRNFAHSEEN